MYVWSRAFAEKWSAFEPGFVELDDNEEYVEREDEFDVAERKRPLSDPSGSVAKALANRELVARGAAVEAAARVTEAELAVRRELEAMEKGEAAEAEERRKAELEAAKPEGAEGATSEGGARPPTRLDVKTETALVALVDASAPVALVSGADANANDGAGSKSAVRAVDQSAALELAATLRGARSEAAAAAAAAAETASLMKSSDLMLAATQAKAREEARDAAERAATLGMTSSELDPELVDVDVWTSPRGFFSDEEEDAADVMRHLPMDLGPDPEATLVIETRTARWREREKRTLEEEKNTKNVGEGDGTVVCPSGAEKDEKSALHEEQVFAVEKTSSAGDKRKRATSDE
jgi:COMPASS component SWD1